MPRPTTTTDSKPRAKKPLPASLAALTLDDYDKFTLEHFLQGENAGDDPGERAGTGSMRAKSVMVGGKDGEDVTYELAKLSSDHLKVLCKQLKIKGMSSKPKDYILERMADTLLYAQECAARDNSDPELKKKRMLNSVEGGAEARKALVQQITESNIQSMTHSDRAMLVDLLKMEFTHANNTGNDEEAANVMKRVKKIRSSYMP